MSPPARRAQESATERLSRLLTMVPWLLAHQGVDIDAAAEQFGLTRAQLEADLMLLFVCGTPGHLPDDLIEAEWEDGRVYVGNADTISRPLRLNVDEALTLMVGLRALAATAGVAERDAVLSALAKLEQATGETAGAASRMTVALADTSGDAVLADATRAAREQRRVHLSYQPFGRDEVTERAVDPMRVVNLEGRWYLEGWCHRAEDTRLFRLDRVQALHLLDEPGIPPVQARPRDLDGALYQAAPTDTRVTVVVDPAAAWVPDYYLAESVETLPDGRLRCVLAAADPGWVRRLAWRLGGLLTVQEPAGLAAQVRAGAAAALAAYPEAGAADEAGTRQPGERG